MANSVVVSKLCYLIQVWGGTEDYLIKSLQVCLNKAARCVTGMSWFTPTGVFMRKCGWMSVKQLICCHTLLTMHKTVQTKSPQYLHEKITTQTDHNTRRQVKFSENFSGKTERTKQSYCYRGATLYNKLPLNISNTQSINSFKYKVKKWIKANIPID